MTLHRLLSTPRTIAVALGACGLTAVVLAGCQAPAAVGEGEGVLLVNSQMASGAGARRVLEDAELPLTRDQVALLRIRLRNHTTNDIVFKDVLNPTQFTPMSFRHLRANTDYTVDAYVFLEASPASLAEAVASDSTEVEVTSTLDPYTADLTLQLRNVAFAAEAAVDTLDVLPGTLETVASATMNVVTGAVSTLTGDRRDAGAPTYLDGPARDAAFNQPQGFAVYNNHLYVADTDNHLIRDVDLSTGAVSTLAGGVGVADYNNATGTAARFSSPRGIVADGLGNLYVADSGNYTIRKIAIATGVVSTVAGLPTFTGVMDGPLGISTFGAPHHLAFLNDTLYITDTQYNQIRTVDTLTNTAGTFAGAVSSVGGYQEDTVADGVQSARFNKPSGLVVTQSGDETIAYVADRLNHVIRKVTRGTAGVTTETLAGDAGTAGFQNSAGGTVRFSQPTDLALDGDQLLVTDSVNHVIRAVRLDGTTTTFAGSGIAGFFDGALLGTRFNSPRAIAQNGSVSYVWDHGNRRIRRLQ